MPAVDLIFPNVEIRLDIKTDKIRSINMHLLFSPDDPNHEGEIERLLEWVRNSLITGATRRDRTGDLLITN